MERGSSAQRHRQLHRRQNGVGVDAEEALSSIVDSVASAVASVTAKGGRVVAAASDDDDGDEGTNQPLSACSVSCLTVHLGNDCRTVSCMCSSPELATANTCIAACPRKDRGEFLNNVQSWCGNAQAAALINPGPVSALSSSTALSRARSSATEASSSAISGSTIATVLSATDRLSLSSTVSSVATSTTRRVSTITTTASTTLNTEDESLETSRINPKVNNAEATSISTSDDSSNNAVGTSEKKGVSTGTVVGIVIGMTIAFVIIGLCTWFVRRSLLGRHKKGKEFLRSSDPGDWVNNDIINKEGHGRSTGAGGGAGQVEFDEKFDTMNENDRIDRTMQERSGSLISNQTLIQPGIGAYARHLPQTPRSSSNPAGYGNLFPTESGNNGHRQSQRQYEDMHASLAYPSHMGILPTSPYNTHPQFYAQQQQVQPQFDLSQQQHVQPVCAATPHTSMQSMMMNDNNGMMTPHSAGLDSTRANLSHREGPVNGSPYPESITMTPEISHVVDGESHVSNGLSASQLGKHESIPFIIPTALQNSSGIATIGTAAGHSHQNSHSYSGSMSGLPRSLTAGGIGDRLSTSTSSNPIGIPSTIPQRRTTQQSAQIVPLPPSTPPGIGNAALSPMPLPGMTNAMPDGGTNKTDEGNDSSRTVKELPTVPEVKSSENPFLDMNEDDADDVGKEKKRESFTDLAYLAK